MIDPHDAQAGTRILDFFVGYQKEHPDVGAAQALVLALVLVAGMGGKSRAEVSALVGATYDALEAASSAQMVNHAAAVARAQMAAETEAAAPDLSRSKPARPSRRRKA